MREYLFIVVIAAVVTYAATPLLRSLAVRLRAFTPVRDRDVHSVPIPRLGGVAMLLGFGAATLVASVLPFSKQMFEGPELTGVLFGAVIVCLVGAIDDAVLLYGHAKPIGAPVVARGPFVMNTEQEIHEAIADYRSGKFGDHSALGKVGA